MSLTFQGMGQHGWLGNQMFQFATLHACAQRLKTDYALDADHPGLSVHKFSGFPAHCLKSHDAYTAWFMASMKQHFVEQHFRVHNELLGQLLDGTNLRGYFQSEKYFKDYRADLLKMFSLDTLSSDALRFKMLIQQSSTSISVHFRRTDYLKASNFHTDLFGATQYYQNALTYFTYRLPNEKWTFFVFSDDIAWAKENFHKVFSGDATVIFVEGQTLPHEEIILQSLCKHNIIANSSFSWWGAWLGNQEGRVVCAPREWFAADGPKDIQDIYAENWVTI